MVASVDAVMREELRSVVADPPTVVHHPEGAPRRVRCPQAARSAARLRIRGVCGIALGLTIVAARMLLFSGLGTDADNLLYGQIPGLQPGVVIFTTIVGSAVAARVRPLPAHQR
ncbi:MAG: hypothetical protein IPH72_26990 [Sandaracinaceae bacterium]|nr:hypothetical protein [Sandaracinaceae bacterium]